MTKVLALVAGVVSEVDVPGGAGVGLTIKTASFTAAVANEYVIAADALTATLPSTPAANDRVRFCTGSTALTAFTVARNGSNIMGLAEDMTTSLPYFTFELVYADAGKGWVLA